MLISLQPLPNYQSGFKTSYKNNYINARVESRQFWNQGRIGKKPPKKNLQSSQENW